MSGLRTLRGSSGIAWLLARLLTGLLTGVFAASVFAESTTSAYEVRALVTSRNWTIMSSEIVAPIAKMHRHPGERFNKGDALISFNCATYEAQRAGGAADVRQASVQLQSQQRLLELQSIGALEVDIAHSQLDRARANLQLQDVYLQRCKIPAPFDGTVVRWIAQPFQTVSAGDEVIELVSSSGLELELIVSSSWLSWLKIGQTLTARIDETGAAIQGTVSYLGARVDPVSQTIKIYASITSGGDSLIPGMSGSAMFPEPKNHKLTAPENTAPENTAPGNAVPKITASPATIQG